MTQNREKSWILLKQLERGSGIGRIIRDDRSDNLFDLVPALNGGDLFEYEYAIGYLQ